ncbi:DNA mismatch repair protein MutT [Embleya scabrispora]|uniref:DNA mismatch repair protein MutT n=1 Tax=Embleya scabrispora TaxID=159449 RepID=A0A1T3NWN5_9ACTN|nr:NUDIX domain-containing protein [Embleya scabrispora]OPC81269.1 DNA mismatch repair protein MutT [Embleya scabrispora]
MARTDYYDDPNAPVPNSLVVAASVVVADERRRVLVQRRADSGNWALPGGTMNLGESLPQCAVRETREETGLVVEIVGLVGMYTDPRHVIAYADGEVRQQFNVCFVARIIGGELTPSDESTALGFRTPAELRELPMHYTQRLRLRHYLAGEDRPYLG